MSPLIPSGKRPLLAPGRTWFALADIIIAIVQAVRGRRQ
jgi:hypothetical protein